MPDITLNSGKTGRIQRAFDSEGELYAFVVQWCVQRDEHIIATVQIGSQDLFSLKAGNVYRVEAGPSGDGDGEGYIRVRWVSDG